MSELMAKLARRRSLNGEESIPKIESKIDTTLISQSNNDEKSDETQQNIDVTTVTTDIDTNNEQLKPNNEVSNNETNNEVSTNVDDNTLSNIDLRDSTQDNRSSNSDKKDPSQPSNNSKWYPGKYLGFKPRTDKGDAKNSSGDNDNRNSNVDTLEKDDMDTAIDKDIDDFLSTINDKETSNKSFYKRNKSSSNDNLFDDTDDNISGLIASSSRDGTSETLEIQNTKLKLQVANLVKEIRYKDQTILNLQKEKALLVSELNNSIAAYVQSGGLAKDSSVDPNFNDIQAKMMSIKSIKDSYYALLSDINTYLKQHATQTNLSGSLQDNGTLTETIKELEKKNEQLNVDVETALARDELLRSRNTKRNSHALFLLDRPVRKPVIPYLWVLSILFIGLGLIMIKMTMPEFNLPMDFAGYVYAVTMNFISNRAVLVSIIAAAIIVIIFLSLKIAGVFN
jgi:hypothetical protein